MAAGLAVGFWKSTDELKEHWAEDRRFDPLLSAEKRAEHYKGWQKAVTKAKGWID